VAGIGTPLVGEAAIICNSQKKHLTQFSGGTMISRLAQLKSELKDYLRSELGELYSDLESEEIWEFIEKRKSDEEVYEWCLTRFSGGAMQRRMGCFAKIYKLNWGAENYKILQTESTKP
jgi:hypothetical protein